jgi:hypothetical protein
MNTGTASTLIEEGTPIMSRRNGTRIVRNRRFQTKQRDQGLTRKPLTLDWLERHSSPMTRLNG